MDVPLQQSLATCLPVVLQVGRFLVYEVTGPMIDVHLPTTDGRKLRLTRYTQPEPELQLLIRQLKLQLAPQPPPKIATAAVVRVK